MHGDCCNNHNGTVAVILVSGKVLTYLVPCPPRTLVPQANGYSRDSLQEFLTQVAQESTVLSWKELLSVLQGPSKHHTTRTPLTSVSRATQLCI